MESGVVSAQTHALSKKGSEEGRHQRARRNTTHHNKRSHGTCYTSLNGEKYGKQNSKPPKAPGSKELGVILLEAEAIGVFK